MRNVWNALCVCLVVLMCGSFVAAQEKPGAAADKQVNLNTATLDQLDDLPGIGRATAQRILDYRQKNGGFKKIEELMNVKGIGEKSFLKLKPLIVAQPRVEKAGQ